MRTRAECLQSIFAAALEAPAASRAEFLAAACADDVELRREIEGLLAADARLEGTTTQPVLLQGMGHLLQAIESAAPAGGLSGMRVGPYELCNELGRGGMGCVYRAVRIDGTVTQQVAIKFVRRELLDANTVRRFELERRLLATLDDPHIARLLDAATLPDGAPYFVMEYVDGVPVTDYCERERLDARARAALMRKVCGAVAAAHRELVVHRDLKPANILVTAAGVPKLLDFGIAKLLDDTVDAELTGTAQRYFSPQYCAPEQLSGASVGVACDVYSLGLLLYEALAGCRPFDVAGSSAAKFERLVLESVPAPPSAALARRAQATGPVHPRQLTGDLDGIVMLCLRKAPHERYASVERLEADLENFLEGRPVQARGGHRWYRAQKFVRRNLGAVAAVSLFALALVAGLVAFAWQAQIARQRAAELEQVARFQAQMLSQVDWTRAGAQLSDDIRAKYAAAIGKTKLGESERDGLITTFGQQLQLVNATDAARELIARTILNPSVEAVGKQFKDQPLVEATLTEALAERYRSFGSVDAVPLQQRALDLRSRLLGDEHLDTLTSRAGIGEIYTVLGKYTEAEPHLRDVLEKRRRALGTEHPDTLDALADVGFLLSKQGKHADAERVYRDVLAQRRRVLGDDHEDTIDTISNLAQVLRIQGRFAEGSASASEGLERSRRVLGTDHPATQKFVAELGASSYMQGKFAEAEPYFREVYEVRSRVLGEAHPQTLSALNNLVVVRATTGAPSDVNFLDMLEKYRHFFGNDHPETLRALANIGAGHQNNSQWDEAEPYMRESFDGSLRVLGDEHEDTLMSEIDLTAILIGQRRYAEAVELCSRFEAPARKTFSGPNARGLGRFLAAYGRGRTGARDFAAAEKLLLEAHATFSQLPEPRPSDLKDASEALAELYAAWHEADHDKVHESKATEWKQRAASS